MHIQVLNLLRSSSSETVGERPSETRRRKLDDDASTSRKRLSYAAFLVMLVILGSFSKITSPAD